MQWKSTSPAVLGLPKYKWSRQPRHSRHRLQPELRRPLIVATTSNSAQPARTAKSQNSDCTKTPLLPPPPVRGCRHHRRYLPLRGGRSAANSQTSGSGKGGAGGGPSSRGRRSAYGGRRDVGVGRPAEFAAVADAGRIKKRAFQTVLF